MAKQAGASLECASLLAPCVAAACCRAAKWRISRRGSADPIYFTRSHGRGYSLPGLRLWLTAHELPCLRLCPNSSGPSAMLTAHSAVCKCPNSMAILPEARQMAALEDADFRRTSIAFLLSPPEGSRIPESGANNPLRVYSQQSECRHRRLPL